MEKDKKAKRIPTRKELLKASAAFMKLAYMFRMPDKTGASFWESMVRDMGTWGNIL